jgi:hypothetical protein
MKKNTIILTALDVPKYQNSKLEQNDDSVVKTPIAFNLSSIQTDPRLIQFRNTRDYMKKNIYDKETL